MTVKHAVEVYPTLQRLAKSRKKNIRKNILSSCPCKVMKVISEIAKNILSGSIQVPKNKLKLLKLYKHDLRTIANQKDTKKIKKILIQKGGFLPALLKPALTLLASYAASKLT